MSLMKQVQGPEVSPKTAAIVIGVTAVLVAGVAMFFIKSHNQSNSAGADNPPAQSASSVKVDVKESTDSKKADSKKDDKPSPAKSVPAWKMTADRDLFRPMPGVAVTTTENKPHPSVPRTMTSVRPMPLGPMPGLSGMGMGFRRHGSGDSGKMAYTGLVETPKGQMALIENSATGETKYAAVGDEVFGMRIVSIDSKAVTMDSGARLAIGENKPQQAQAPQGAPQGGQGANSNPQPGGQPSPQGNSERHVRRMRGGGGEPGGPQGGNPG